MPQPALTLEQLLMNEDGEMLPDMLSCHLADISRSAERIADALEAVLERLPRG